ncbi:uncharacterized protein E5676_scaffold2044G00180 [Cucumis melo var. makuwa]|uniref:DUF4218 domain-containing protein n=1 Tax=Cucumis melo var. makuwa TaxID=1194695 RepID=A0A5D3BQ47_CUCMM|nr:uncharacterized protein E5676_scaffold2044G00180 [Cucumis melo var. makuwa]
MYPSYTELVYNGELVNLYRGIERFDEGTSSDPFHEGTNRDPFHEGTSGDPFHVEGTSSNMFSEDNEMLGMLHDLQGPIKHKEKTAEEAGLENEMFKSGVEEEMANIFQELLNQARRELYHCCSEFSSLNIFIMLMHVKEFSDLTHCPTCGESRYKASLIKWKNPHKKCMKESNFFMSLLIPGPRSTDREIDVYLQPLIEELKHLQSLGVRTYDILIGYQACPIYMGDKSSFGIKGKIAFMEHQRYLLDNHLLPIGIRVHLSKNVYTAVTELCSVFCDLCMRTISVSDLDRLQADIIIKLCKLEEIFPPAFSYVMVHHVVHLLYEAKVTDPVNYTWMYSIEKSMCTLKHYVRNKACPKGSITKTYVMNESSTFCSRYISGIETQFSRDERNNDRIPKHEIVESNVGTSISSYPEGSQPLSRDEKCDIILGRQSSYSKGLGCGPKPKSQHAAGNSSSTSAE